MNKVYIVTAGELDDYHICGVFESREAAEKTEALFEPGQATIEEWPTNNESIDYRTLGYGEYRVAMLHDGTVTNCLLKNDGKKGRLSNP